ncbi:MAG: hypothetical protein D6706_08640 [Chloroflexi bacterium]|nr:MAG: hypothetical protein D6706_08640 [Chloroflexota bacterium]
MTSQQPSPADLTPVTGSCSVERLVHFRCGACRRWWSIGDAPPDRTDWYCPWCGQKQQIQAEQETEKRKQK